MADDKKIPDENPEDHLDTPGDSGLGNLPPLSDFDSGGMDSDGGLPPLGNFDSGGSPSDSAGLPPISDIQVETPQPTGGNVKPTPAGFDRHVNDTFSSGTPGIDTPVGMTSSRGASSVGSGFQDLAADSDFSPETPEIGPGPDSNMDTPMFDSAFGGGSGSGFGSGDTGAPTQSMETPMFGQERPDQRGFEPNAFGGSGGDFGMGGGTPAPDFSPDTDMRVGGGGGGDFGGGGGMPPVSEPSGRGGGGLGLLVAALIALIIGVVAGPFVSAFVPFLPNPARDEAETQTARVAVLETDLRAKEKELQKYININPDQVQDISPDALNKLREDIQAATEQLTQAEAALAEKTGQLETAQSDLETVTEEYVARRDQFETLSNELSISQARQRGLVAEVERLTNQVGQLDEADERRTATKQALEHAVDRLYVRIKEGIPLTPAKYSREDRLARVEELRNQVDEAKWVTPELQDAYTDLYLDELAIAEGQEYFFSKIPVVDSYGSRVRKWAECLMVGNHEVLYRTFDGENIGVFKKVGNGSSPAWGFTEDLPPAAIEARIMENRVEGFEEKVQALAERQLAMEDENSFQRAFSSL